MQQKPTDEGTLARIVVPMETRPGGVPVASTPRTVEQLIKLGYDVAVKTGAGHVFGLLAYSA